MQKLYIILALLIVISLTEAKKQRKQHKQQSEETNIIEDTRQDPCLKLKCGPGKECVVNVETGDAKCQCVSECADNTDLRRRVCSNHNTTWQSDCHLFRHHCMCLEGLSKDCIDDHKHMHIDYYGECQLLPECKKEVLDDFPRRMTEWLDTIMSKKIPKPSDDAHITKKWVDAIIWKFCDLDKQPHDRHVSRHELFPLRAPLLSMESCISSFLDNCDSNNDHKITLVEWGECLGATQSNIFYTGDFHYRGRKWVPPYAFCYLLTYKMHMAEPISVLYNKNLLSDMEDKCAQFKALQSNEDN